MKETVSSSHWDMLPEKPNYGYYYFKPYMLMLAFFVVVGLLILAYAIRINQLIVFGIGVAIVVYGILTTIAWALARYIIPGNRIKFARNIATSLNLSGSEVILDVGSGRGLYAIEFAEKLKTGKVIGIDIWEPDRIANLTHHHKLSQPTGNTISNARQNARIEGVDHKIEFISMDANHLEFENHSFDLVVCGFVISHLKQYGMPVLIELRRVLKPGCRLILIDNFRDFTYLLLSTPHLFILSYLKGSKAKQLTKKRWISMITKAGFKIIHFETGRSIVVIEGKV